MPTYKYTSKIYVFTGEGKGKTTAAMGLAVLNATRQRFVRVVQFLKGTGYTGELTAADHFAPYLTIKQFGFGCPIAEEIREGRCKCSKCGQCFRENRNPLNQFAHSALQYAAAVLKEGPVDVLLLDEISHAINRELIAVEAVRQMIVARPPGTDIILTGRNMPQALLELADEITNCAMVKHPMRGGIDARRGTEY